MKTAFKTLILYCLTLAVLFSGASCEKDAKREEGSSQEESAAVTQAVTDTQGTALTETPPEKPPFDVTAPEGTIPEVTETEVTEPEETMPKESTTETTEPNTDTSLEDVSQSTTPEETTAPEPPHEHTLINGQCACGYVTVVEIVSSYDNDKNGDNDIFYFSPLLPETFKSLDVVQFSAGDYTEGSGVRKGTSSEGENFYYWYCREGEEAYLIYEVEVAEAGVYEMAIRQKIRDCDACGAKFTVNEGSKNAYSIETSYQFSQEDLQVACDNEQSMSSYMLGIELELAAGVNFIKIEAASNTENNQFFREFYLVKTGDSVDES